MNLGSDKVKNWLTGLVMINVQSYKESKST